MKTLHVEILIVAVLGLLSIIEGIRLHFSGSLQITDILGPGLYNVGIGALILAADFFYFISQRKETHKVKKPSPEKNQSASEYRKMMIGIIISMVAYIFLLEMIGYLFASAAFFFLINRIVGFHRWVTNVSVTILMTAFTYLIFVVWLGMIFPRGMIFDF